VALGARVWHGRPRRAQISASHANSLRRLPPAQWGSSSPLPSAPPQLGTRCVPARNTTTTRSRCPPTYPPPAPREQLVPARATSMKLGPPGCTAAAQGLVGPKCSRADAALHSEHQHHRPVREAWLRPAAGLPATKHAPGLEARIDKFIYAMSPC
jgi:hypothetical protein